MWPMPVIHPTEDSSRLITKEEQEHLSLFTGQASLSQATDQVGHIIDISATFRDITGAIYPKTVNGKKTKDPVGKSLLPIFKGKKREPQRDLLALYANAIRQGDLKAVRQGRSAWEFMI